MPRSLFYIFLVVDAADLGCGPLGFMASARYNYEQAVVSATW
jgi:hypothetical protein